MTSWATDARVNASTSELHPRFSGRRAIAICDQWLGSDGYAGMQALRRSGWDVHVAAEWEYVPVKWRSFPMKVAGKLIRPAAVREFNAEVRRQALRLRPEMLLVFKGTFLTPDTLIVLRDMGVRSYCFYPDVSFRAHGRYIPRALPHYDWVFTTKSFGIADMREQLGVTRSSLIHFAFDPDLHRPLPLSRADVERYGCDVSYIGTWSPKKEKLLAELIRRRPAIRVKIWGESWNNAREAAVAPAVGGREVIGQEFVRAVLGSSINLSIMSEARRGASRGDQIASRTFAVPACGAFVLHERTSELLELFREGEEVACFEDIDELVKQVDRYLEDDVSRRRIAEQGMALVRSRHSWDERIRTILDHHDGCA
jgi:spore maturation protein CgeB